MAAIGSCMLGPTPRVALAIRDDMSTEAIYHALSAGVDLLEMRIDQFTDRTAEHVLNEVKRFPGIPRIGTIRMKREGGAWQGTEEERLDLYTAILPEVEAVDIELSATGINRQVISRALRLGRTVIGSFHDFQKTPPSETFSPLIQTAEELGVTIIKFATYCSCAKDVRLLAQVLLNHPDKNMVVLGMGIHGRISRFLLPALGSLITYTFLGTPSAPGQATLEETLHLLKLLYGAKK